MTGLENKEDYLVDWWCNESGLNLIISNFSRAKILFSDIHEAVISQK